MSGSAGWTQVLVRVGDADAVLVADRLWAFGPAAIEERDDGSVLLVAGYDDPDRAGAAGAAVEALGVRSVHLRVVDDDGLDAWRDWARVEHAGPFTIVPAWLPVPEPPGGLTSPIDPTEPVGPTGPVGPTPARPIVLDPGRTFGSGSHPTTRLVLAALARLVAVGDRVLDVGCGSGVLSIGAAILGADAVVAIDVDPEAPPTTDANARVNGVADRIAGSTDDLSLVVARGERFDVIAANLLAPVVVALRSDLIAALAPGGTLVVSGLLADRWEATASVLAPLVVAEVAHDEGWTAVELRHP